MHDPHNDQIDIMIVDDQPANLQLLDEMLSKRGYNVRPLPSAKLALKAIEKSLPDIILLDINMPVMDGYAMCTKLKGDPHFKEIPILFISAINDASAKVRAFEVGGVDYITKPFDIEELNARIDTHLKIQNYQRELETYKNELELKVQKQSALMLQQSRLAQMGEMISLIAHQWRQPLSSIAAIAGTLTMDVLMDTYKKEFFKERLDSISNLSVHLSSTIDDFRNFFKESTEKRPSSFQEIAKESLEIINPALAAKGIRVHTRFETSQEITTYPSELKQVLLNLIKNAEEALMENKTQEPQIWISAYTKEDMAYLSIEDNGGGIKDEHMEKIFDPYFSTKEKKEGAGLGLYMSKIIVEEHCHGLLTVTNSQRGPLFTIAVALA